jgi:hypothetical protein
LLVFAWAGCGSSAPADPTVLPIGNWANEVAAVECGHLFGCCPAAVLMTRPWTDEAQCRQMVAAEVQTAVRDTIGQGIVTYDGKAARRCIDETAAVDCMHLPAWGIDSVLGPSCNHVFPGTFPLGAACEDLDVVCQSGNCTGTCAPPRPCFDVSCDAGQYCDSALNVCAPMNADGAACAANIECTSPSVCVAGACGAPLPEGTPCASDNECTSGVCSTSSQPNACSAIVCPGT